MGAPGHPAEAPAAKRQRGLHEAEAGVNSAAAARDAEATAGLEAALRRPCPNGCEGPEGHACPLHWHDVPRLSAAPDQDVYLRDYALPRVPFVLTAESVKQWGWPAAQEDRWKNLRYFEDHPQLLAMERLFDTDEGFRPVALRAKAATSSAATSGADGGGLTCAMTPREAVQTLRGREAQRGLGGSDGVCM
eukprot:TRINITY_DN37962_c0_g1_i1.p3 TRINITY_DN37962_c0_g1~~TRINITY_DN37962_c0_g1_i1.p3  ORF type:complete len:191 (-),score=38.29 TRINITY_DN37962_c0_g1_i1:912-1484(-)